MKFEKPLEPESQPLRGSLAPKPKLRGTLVEGRENMENRLAEQTYLQRDSEDEFMVKSVDEEKDRIVLQRAGSTMTIALDLGNFKKNIETEGSPWSVKER